MNKIISGTIPTLLLLVALLTTTIVVQSSANYFKTNGTETSFSIDTAQLVNNQSSPNKEETREHVNIVGHRISTLELERLKKEVGVYQEGKNYNQIIGGYGTGLRPPTEKEWAQVIGNAYIVEKILLDGTMQAPSFVDHSTTPWFPPIGNQGGEGSCAAWAVGYYMKTFQEAKEHDWNLSSATWGGGNPSVEYQDWIISPDFIYHLINGGVDAGSTFYDAIELVCFVGASSWKTMPYKPADHTSWPSEEAWREAPWFRGNSSGFEYMLLETDLDLTDLKNWLASDHLAVIGVDAYKYSLLTGNDIWTLDNYVNPNVNHANTIVGYDDNLTYNENGTLHQGAFKIANSWGVGSWEQANDGCYWISYEAMKKRVGDCMFYHDRIGYEPDLVASFKITHSKRGECDITIGLESQTKRFSQYVRGGDQPFCSNNIFFDITEVRYAISDMHYQRFYGQQFFLKIYDGGTSTIGTINEFAVENKQSGDLPISTVNGNNVYAYVTLYETIYILGDGSVDPSTAPIQRSDDVYVLTGNITSDENGVRIERNNITLDGTGRILQGSGTGIGIDFRNCGNVTVKNMTIKNFDYGIYLNQSSNYNCIVGNNITKNDYGIQFLNSSNNKLYHNNFINNTNQQVSVQTSGYANVWDNGYPSGGNYWSDYVETDLHYGPCQNKTGSDGIGDTPYVIDENNTDRYPLTNLWMPCDIAVINVTPSKTIVGRGLTLGVNVTVTNLGNKIEAFNITVYANINAITTFTNINLSNENSTTITFSWNTTGFAYGNYTLWTYAWPILGERNTLNNNCTYGKVIVTLAGDFDGDGFVYVDDLDIFGRAWYSKKGDINYNPNCDFDGDGFTYIEDLDIFGRNWYKKIS